MGKMGQASTPAFRLLDDADDSAGARVRRVGGLTFWAETLTFRTTAAREFRDVTDQVADVVRRSGVAQGWVSGFSKHTRAARALEESEPLLPEHLGAMRDRLAPSSRIDR